MDYDMNVVHEGAFYRDGDEDVWFAVSPTAVMFVALADPDYDDVRGGDIQSVSEVGPLVEVTPTWAEV